MIPWRRQGGLDAIKASKLYDKWPEIIGLGEKMDFVSVCNDLHPFYYCRDF